MKKNYIIVGSIFMLIIAILITIFVLYTATDIFKTNSQMFQKYFAEDIKQINNVLDLTTEKQYLETLGHKNYKDDTQIVLNYKNAQGNLEQFKISSRGVTNNDVKNSYRQISVKNGEDKSITNIEFLQENQQYGLRFSDVVKQFVTTNVTDLNSFFEKISINKTQIQKYDVSKIWNLLINEKENLENVIKDFAKQADNNQYSKKKNAQITLSNGQSQTTTEYSMKLSSEQTKKLFINILKELDNQKLINEINESKKQFTETEITIYVLENKTSRLVVQLENREIRIDFYENELDIKYNMLSTEELKTIEINLKKDNEKTYVKYVDSENNIKIEYTKNQDLTNANASAKFDLQNQYIQDLNINIEQKLDISNSTIDIQKKFANEPNVILDNMNVSTKNSALNSLLQRIDAKILVDNSEIKSEILSKWLELNKDLEEMYQGLKQKEIEDFNNLFMPYKGTKIEKNIILNMLDVVGANLQKYETLGEDRIKIYIEQGKKNEDVKEEIKKIIDKSNDKFNIDFKYDNSGKIGLILMEVYKENR